MATTVDVSGLQAGVRSYARDRAAALGERFVEVARGFAPRRTGEGADSIEAGDVSESSSGFSLRITVGAIWMRYQNEGTGIYGPDGAPITPTSGNVLVFDWPAAGGLVFARSVRGTEPTHWWERALEQWPSIVRDAA